MNVLAALMFVLASFFCGRVDFFRVVVSTAFFVGVDVFVGICQTVILWTEAILIAGVSAYRTECSHDKGD